MRKLILALSLGSSVLLLGSAQAEPSNEIDSETITSDADRNYKMYHKDYQYGSFRDTNSTPRHGGNYNRRNNNRSNGNDNYNDNSNRNYNSSKEQYSNDNARYYYRNS